MPSPYQLSDEEKSRVQAEEGYRLEVRRELTAKEAPPKGKDRLWKILNSSFALWFLSSVVVAGTATGFAHYEAKRSEDVKQAETIRRLDTEIVGRITEARYGLCLDLVNLDKGTTYTPASIYGYTLRYFNNSFAGDPQNPQDYSIYPEYKTRTLRSLVFELSTLVDEPQVPMMKQLLIDYEKFADLGSIQQNQRADREAARHAVNQLLQTLNRYLGEDRWRRHMLVAGSGECEYLRSPKGT
jgi:hypothetical protein